MRYILIIAAFCSIYSSCKKDKFASVPQIKFKEFKPAEGNNINSIDYQPFLILEVTDGDGDLGFKLGKDTAKVYIKNLLTNKEDSLSFPDITTAAVKNFKADVSIGLFSVMGGRNLPVNQRPYRDTLKFQVYIKDFAKNKSNVIITDKPFIYFTLP